MYCLRLAMAGKTRGVPPASVRGIVSMMIYGVGAFDVMTAARIIYGEIAVPVVFPVEPSRYGWIPEFESSAYLLPIRCGRGLGA